ncbi:MAG: hypothetical protein ABIL68_05125 [bacterium]
MSRKKMMEFFAEHKMWLLLGSLFLAFLLLAFQYFSNVVSEYQSKKDQEMLRNENKVLQQEVRRLSEQNIELLKQVDVIGNKAEMIKQIGVNQLLATFYTEELNSGIGSVKLRMYLKTELILNDLRPIKFAFEIMTIDDDRLSIRKYVEDREGSNILDYNIRDVSLTDGKCSNPYQYGQLIKKVKAIEIPIVYPENIGMVKNFHDEKLFLYLSENLLDKISYVELIVNGWAILHEEMKDSTWEKVKINGLASWEKFQFKDLELYRSWLGDRKSSYHPGWKINLYNKIPKVYESLKSRWSDF